MLGAAGGTGVPGNWGQLFQMNKWGNIAPFVHLKPQNAPVGPAEGVGAAVERPAFTLEQLLRGERHKNSEARRGQASLYLYAVERQRQRGHQAVLLLEVQ